MIGTVPVKGRVRVASIGANVTVSAPGTTLDGVTLAAGNRVLLKDQTTGSQNGVYQFNGSAVAMTRSWDMSESGIAGPGHQCYASEGTVNAGTTWQCTTVDSIVLGTTSLAYKRMDGAWDSWKTLTEGYGQIASSAAAGNYMLQHGGLVPVLNTVAMTGASCFLHLDPTTNYSIPGKTPQIRLVATVITGSTAPGATFTFRLVSLSSVAAGVATLGSVIATATVTTPALNTMTTTYSAASNMPATAHYILDCTLNTGNAAGSTPILRCDLQVRAT